MKTDPPHAKGVDPEWNGAVLEVEVAFDATGPKRSIPSAHALTPLAAAVLAAGFARKRIEPAH